MNWFCLNLYEKPTELIHRHTDRQIYLLPLDILFRIVDCSIAGVVLTISIVKWDSCGFSWEENNVGFTCSWNKITSSQKKFTLLNSWFFSLKNETSEQRTM